MRTREDTANVKTIVQISLIDDTGDSCHRMRYPGRQIAEQNPHWRVINLDFRAEERFEWGLKADLLCLLQCGDVDMFPTVFKRKALGKKTFIEINDNFYSPQPWNPARRRWNSPVVWNRYEALMALADGVIVTGAGLAELISSKAEGKTHVLKNHFPFVPKEFTSKPTATINLGWAGSAGHMADLISISPMLKKLFAEFPHVRFHAMGDPSIVDFMNLPRERLVFTPWGSMEQYFDFWKKVHIGIVPLLDSEYNRCRSDIKPVEIAGTGTLPIVQKNFTYETFLRESQVPSYQSTDELEVLLRKYISNTKLIESHSRMAYDYICEHRILNSNTERSALYAEALQSTSPSDFDWKRPPGFYEVRGQIETSSTSDRLIKSAQALSSQQRWDEAAQELRKGFKENPYQADFAFFELKCLQAAKSPEFENRLLEYKSQFTNDLRFKIIENYRMKADEKYAHLISILDAVKAVPADHREFYWPEIQKLLSNDLSSYPTDKAVSILKSCKNMLPFATEIRLQLAHMLYEAKEYESARAEFQELQDLKAHLDRNAKTLSNIPEYVFPVWLGCLDSYLKT